VDEACDADAFRAAMSLLHVGSTIKITGVERHGPADALLLEHVDLEGASIADIGVSDGSTSVELVAKLPQVASFVLADLYLVVDVAQVGRTMLFHEPSGRCILIAGRRLLAWPSLSRTVAVLCAPVVWAARRERRPALLLGPEARELVARDERVQVRVHDVFEPWRGPAPDVVKVANVLRRLYFPDAAIRRALVALHAGLSEGGHLLLVDNPRIPGIAVRGGLYRKAGGSFVRVAETEHAPEIADLVAGLDVPEPSWAHTGA
jgi:hypothetical protein